MSSIGNDANGRKRILFEATDGKRKTLRIGKATKKQAESVQRKVDQLIAAAMTGHPPDRDTLQWLVTLDDRLHDRLSGVGLVQPRVSTALGAWLTIYLGERADLKPGSRALYATTKKKLLDHFGDGRSLTSITPGEAAEWRAKLQAEKLAPATVNYHVGNAKGFFAEACRRKLIAENPMQYLKGGAVAASSDRYVTPEEAEGIIAKLPDVRWKLLFGLARYAGLRVPSETNLLTWADVDWGGRLNVRSPKTEHHQGHERRIVPITPRLMELLQDRYDVAEPGEELLVTMTGGYVRRTIEKAAKAAGVAMWGDLFRTLRRSCEIEWATSHPQFRALVVSSIAMHRL